MPDQEFTLKPIPLVSRAAPQAPSAPSARWALASLSLAMLLSSLGTSIANVGLPTLARAFNAPFQQVQWVVLAYLLATTTLVVSAGRLGDMVGRRRLLLAGIALFTLASVLCGMAPTLGLLIAARALQGLGAAVMMALTMALVAQTVPQDKTGSAMGLLGTVSAIGTALGPSLGGLLIAGVGWQALFFINLPLGLLAFFLAYHTLPADGPKAGRLGFDYLGTLLLALTLAAYALAMTLGRGSWGLLNAALLLAAVLGAGLFVQAQKRAVSPLVRMDLFRDAHLRAALTMGALVSTVVMATLVVGPFYLARGLALDAAMVGLVLSTGPLAAGRCADRRARWQVGRPVWRAAYDRCGAGGGLGGLHRFGAAAHGAGYPRLYRPHRAGHCRLRAVPDRQQRRRDGRCTGRPARSHLRPAGLVAQPGPGHRGLADGRGVCLCRGGA